MVSLPSPIIISCFFLAIALHLKAQVTTEWNQSQAYERGVVVVQNDVLYLAHIQVPSGTELTNSIYWEKLENEDPNSPPSDQPSSSAPTGTEQPEETPLPNGLINFSWGFKTIEAHDAETYLVENDKVKKFIDPADALVSYWGPSENEVVANLTYRFDFNGSVKSARARIATHSLNYSSNSSYSGSGFSSVWASSDGSEWTRISNNPTPSIESSLVVFDDQLPTSLMDSSQLFLKIQLQTSGTPLDSYATAQFSKASLNNDEYVFHLDANYSATSDDPGRINYNLGLNEGINYVLSNLETYNLYSASQYGSSVHSAIEQGKLMVTQSPADYDLINISEFNQTHFNLGVTEGVESVLANLKSHNLYSESEHASYMLAAIEEGKLMVTQSPADYDLISISEFNQNHYNLGVAEGVESVLANLKSHNLYSESEHASSVLAAIEEGKMLVTESPSEYQLIGIADFNQTMKQRVQENSFELGFSYLSELIANQATSSETKNNGIRWGVTWVTDRNASSATPYTPSWLYLEQLGWIWTNNSTFPYFYKAPSSSQAGSWLFFEEGSAPPRFYDFQAQLWMIIED
ncbi:MAG: hypothetical protein CBC00_02430 [Verrucomicrobia bacterium TMED40]|nr:MAG: hypothetical protein CBC00_02430 [Verrucomicrobia bacterium TMED40]